MLTCCRQFALVLIWACFPVTLASAAEPAQTPIAPQRVIRLFNGKDLSGFYTWLKGTGRNDPHRVFTVEDGVIHVSGKGLGYLATEHAYKDYHLVLETKWGKYTETGKSVRNSGVLLHGVGPDGAAGRSDDLFGMPTRSGLRGGSDCHSRQGCPWRTCACHDHL